MAGVRRRSASASHSREERPLLSPTATNTQAVAQHSLAVDVDVGQSHRCSWHDASCLCCGACGLCDRDDGADVVEYAPSAAPAPTRCALGAAASSALGGALLALLSLCWMTLFHDKVCGFVAKCGCTWPWAGGWRRCNVHNHTGPRCPWCVASAASPLLNVLSQKSAALAMACVALAQHRYRGVGGQTPQHSERHMLLASLACGVTFGAPLPLLVKVTTISLGNLLVACAPPLFTALCCTGLQNLGVESSPHRPLDACGGGDRGRTYQCHIVRAALELGARSWHNGITCSAGSAPSARAPRFDSLFVFCDAF